jgi:hypothetical protein
VLRKTPACNSRKANRENADHQQLAGSGERLAGQAGRWRGSGRRVRRQMNFGLGHNVFPNV